MTLDFTLRNSQVEWPPVFLIIFLGLSGLILFIFGFLAEAIAGIRDEIRRLGRKKLDKKS